MSLERLEQLDQELSERERYYANFSMVVVIDENSIIHSVSYSAAKHFGYHQRDLLGRKVDVLMNPEDADRHELAIEKYIKTGHSDIVSKSEREVTGVRSDGVALPILLSIGEVIIMGSRYWVGVMREVSDD
jgi:PAS domain S-box-containing protein